MCDFTVYLSSDSRSVWLLQLLETWGGRSSMVSWISFIDSHCMGFERNPQNSYFCSLDYLKNSFLWIKLFPPQILFQNANSLMRVFYEEFYQIFPTPFQQYQRTGVVKGRRGCWRWWKGKEIQVTQSRSQSQNFACGHLKQFQANWLSLKVYNQVSIPPRHVLHMQKKYQ